MIIIRNCNNPDCNKEYSAQTRELNRGNGIYCSRSCSGIMSALVKYANAKSKTPNANCAICKTELYVTEQRRKNSKSGLFFCSREHQAIGFKNSDFQVKPGPDAKVEKRKCSRCSTTLRSNNTICKFCLTDYKIELWLAGDISVTWQKGSREPKDFVKKYLLKTRGDKCEECGFDRKRPNGTSKIQMDHIDGDYTNNEITNLKLLCPNCHDDTETYGSKNKNGGRRYRLAKLANS